MLLCPWKTIVELKNNRWDRSALFPRLYKSMFFYLFNWYNGRLTLFSG